MKKILAVAVAISLTGCAASAQMRKEVDAEFTERQERIGEINKVAEAPTDVIPLPWMGKKLVEIPKSKLPSSFMQLISIGLNSPLPLAQATGEITRLTGVPVKISADVATTGAAGGATGMKVFDTEVTFNFENVALTNILNEISSRLGISWTYSEDDGAIHLSRYTTRVFDMHILPGLSTQTASVSKAGAASAGVSSSGSTGSSGGATGSFASNSSASVNANLDPWKSIEDSLKSMLSAAGKLTVSPATQMITITDTRDVLEKAELFIKKTERSMTRRVRMKTQTIQITTTSDSEAGVNWTAVYKNLSALAPNYNLSFKSLPQAGAVNGGGVNFGIIAPNGGTAGKWDGSTAMLMALQGQGKADSVDTSIALTLNNQAADIAITEQVAYLASVTPSTGGLTPGANGGTAVSGAPGLNPGSVTVGYMMNILPVIVNDQELLLQFSGDISTLKGMGTFTSGGATIQQPSVSAVQILERTKINRGDSIFISGYSKTAGQYDQRGLASPGNMAAGGGFIGKKTRQELVVIITPEWD